MTDTMQERVARVLWKQWHRDSDIKLEEMEDVWRQDKGDFLSMVDAMLVELQEPSEGMVDAGQTASAPPSWRSTENAWQAMIQHIRDGGK